MITAPIQFEDHNCPLIIEGGPRPLICNPKNDIPLPPPTPEEAALYSPTPATQFERWTQASY